jgi:tRNA A-37 threonylcarbamoyl transferase component Bud32
VGTTCGIVRAVESADLTGAVLDGRYKVLEAVAKGAMGTVYRAERLKLGKIVAVKVLHDELPDELSSRKRFEIEATAMAKLEHPNCAAILDVGVHEGRPFVVMDYITGTDLKTLVDAGPVPGPRAIAIVRQVLSGLAHAHELGIIHRDIKPANIILGQKAGLGDHVKILDFGLARLQAESTVSKLTTGIVVGTPAYMAPEQIRGTAIDARADLYACGILLFELLTGKKPFSSPKDDPIEVVSMHLKNPVPRLDAMLPGVDFGELENVVARALQKTAADRFQTATDFVAALDAIHRAIEQSQAISASMMIPAGDTRLGVPAHAAKIASGPVPTAAAKIASGPVPTTAAKIASGPVPTAAAKVASGPVPSAAAKVASGPVASAPAARTTDIGVPAHADSVPPVATHERGDVTPVPRATPSTSSEPTEMPRGSFESHDAPVGLGLVNGARARTPTAQGTLAPSAFVQKPPADEPFTGASTPLVAPVIPTRPDTDPMVHLPPVALPPPSDAATKLPFRLERKHMLIGGGALFVLVIIIIGATRGGDAPATKKPVTTRPSTTDTASGSAPAPVEPPHVEMPGDDPSTEQGVMDRVAADIAASRTDAALGLLLRSRKKYPQNGEIRYLAGTLHFEKRAWADGLAMFREALKIDPYYATNGDFIKAVVKGFATTPAYNDDIAKFLRDQIGSPAEAYLDEVSTSHADTAIRKRAADELKKYQPR